MANEKLKIAVTGMGNRALPRNSNFRSFEGWIRCIEQSPFFELVAAHDIREEPLQYAVQQKILASDQVFNDLDDMLQKVSCDCVLISNPPEHHAATVQKILEYDRHMLVEKPFVHKADIGRELVAQIERKNLVVSIVQNWRTKDVGRRMREVIQEGLLGRVGHVFVRYVRNRENPDYPPYIFEAPYPLLDAMGTHHLDLVRYILDDEFEFIQGHSFKPPYSLYKADSGIHLFLRTLKGVSISYSGTLSSSAGTYTQRNEVLAVDSWVVEGEKGTLFNESRSMEPPLWFLPRGSNDRIDLTEAVLDPSETGQFNVADKMILDNFYMTVKGAAMPLCSARDGLHSIKLLEACQRACASSENIKFNEDKQLETLIQ